MAKSIPSAPIFTPTESEFLSPLTYISKIRPFAEPFGICLIIPPPSFSPPSSSSSFLSSFPTKSQSIHLLQSRSPSLDPSTFSLDFSRFKKSSQKDLFLLFLAVARFGGFRKVQDENQWEKVASFLGKNTHSEISEIYRENLLDFEQCCNGTFDEFLRFSTKVRKKRKKKAVSEMDLCFLFNAVKRFGGFYRVEEKDLWGEVIGVLGKRSSERGKRVLSQVYRENLLDYELHRGDGGVHFSGGSVSEVDQICEQCRSGLHGEVMLLCDRCDKGWHLHCLTPPLEEVPKGSWYCLECVNSEKDSFGFVPGKKKCSLGTFKRRNERARKKWLGNGEVSREEIEKRFWDIVEGRGGEVEVIYGSDLDTSVYGSGFPRIGDPVPDTVDEEVWKKYCSSPWNLNNLPKLPGSMLKAVHDNIAGVMVPWLYMGMLFSSFCWHVEDHCFYSINYLHW